MKYRKIFTFILLLCTIFSTLLIINPSIKAVATTDPPSDLTGATVTVPANWTASAGYGDFHIEGTLTLSNGNTFPLKPFEGTYTDFYIGKEFVDNVITKKENYIVIDYLKNNAYGSTYFGNIFAFTLNITGGADATNQFLIQWLVDNDATFDNGEEPEPEPTYTISGQYEFNDEVTWLYDTSEQEGILYLPFYVYNPDNPTRVNYDYMLNSVREDLDNTNYFLYANETDSGVFTGQYAGRFTTSTTINMYGGERIVYFYTAEVSEEVYTWLNENGQFINDPTLDPNNPENPDSGNNPNNPNNPDFGTDTVRQIVNQVNAFLGIQILPGLSFRDILLICIALPLLMYILKVFLGG